MALDLFSHLCHGHLVAVGKRLVAAGGPEVRQLNDKRRLLLKLKWPFQVVYLSDFPRSLTWFKAGAEATKYGLFKEPK